MAKTTTACEIAGKNCCKDEHKQVQIEKDQQASEFSFQFLKYFPENFFPPANFGADYCQSSIVEFPTANSPPFRKKVSEFILNCVYRI